MKFESIRHHVSVNSLKGNGGLHFMNARAERYASIIDGFSVIKIEPGGATAPHEKYAIAGVIKPLSIRGYEIPIAFFEHKEDTEALLLLQYSLLF